ncbi:MAG: hypothetical protein DFNUSKGM_002953 [Candidatus Fervidibacter sacchari]
MGRNVLMFIVVVLCLNAIICEQKVYERYNEYVLTTSQGDIKVSEAIGTPSLGFSVDDLLEMIFHSDEIPGFYCFGTNIRLNIDGILTLLTRVWLHEEHKIRGPKSPFYEIFIELYVCRNTFEARKRFYSLTRSGEMKAKEGSFSGIPIGEECGHYFPLSTVKLRVGRVVAHVSSTIKDAQSLEDHIYFTEALCIGLEYLLQNHPKVGFLPSKARLMLVGQPKGEVVLLRDVAVGAWSLLKNAGVQGAEARDEKEWIVHLSRGERWVKVKAFSWEMETDKGKVKLERPVFPYKGELIVPLRQVAEALGISVQQKGQTIALLPK